MISTRDGLALAHVPIGVTGFVLEAGRVARGVTGQAHAELGTVAPGGKLAHHCIEQPYAERADFRRRSRAAPSPAPRAG